MQAPVSYKTARPQVQHSRQTVWLALQYVLRLLEAPAMQHFLTTCPSFMEMVLCPGCLSSPSQWPAIDCLKLVFLQAGEQVSLQVSDLLVSCEYAEAHTLWELFATVILLQGLHNIVVLRGCQHWLCRSGNM